MPRNVRARRTRRQNRYISEHFRYDGRAKRKFDSKDDALGFLVVNNIKDQDAYKCGFCKLWHIGHSLL